MMTQIMNPTVDSQSIIWISIIQVLIVLILKKANKYGLVAVMMGLFMFII
jgi:hypothetical protein